MDDWGALYAATVRQARGLPAVLRLIEAVELLGGRSGDRRAWLKERGLLGPEDTSDERWRAKIAALALREWGADGP